jgi:hypothetical protein
MKTGKPGVTILLGMAVLIPATAANIVTNGSFETGSFSGWTIAAASCGSDFGITTNPEDAESGIYAAFFNGSCTGSYDSFEQALPTVAGQNYAVSFWIETQGSGARDLLVDWNGTQILNLSGSGTGSYTLYNFIEPSTTSSTMLEFQGYNTSSNPDFVDNVSASELDEPNTSLLLSLGLGLLCVSGSFGASRIGNGTATVRERMPG